MTKINIKSAEDMLLKTAILVIKTKLQVRNYFVTIEKPLPDGHQIRLSTGSVINLSVKGKIVLQGKPDNDLKEMLGFLRD